MYINGLVSLLIPCYNHENFVADCLESILHQTYTNYEVLICDDASADRSVEIIKEYVQQFTSRGIRLELFVNDVNQGITKNLNKMIRFAKGEFVKSFASDDMMCENHLEKMVHLMENEQIKMAFSNCYFVPEETTWNMVNEKEFPTVWETIPDNGIVEIGNIFLRNWLPAPTFLIRREVFDIIGVYDEQIGIEDLDMTLRILKKYPTGIHGTEESLVYYRRSANSITSQEFNAGALKRMKFMHWEKVKLAHKYRKDVSKKVYRQKLRELWIGYIIQRIHILLKH